MTTPDIQVRLSRGHDEWGPLYTGTYRDHTLTFQHSDTAGQWHVWIKEPNGNEQHGDGYETRRAALDAAVTGIDHALKVADSYAAKWVAEHDSAEPPVYEMPTDSALAACFANCAIKAKPAWYPAIRAAIATMTTSDQGGWFCDGCSTYFGVALDACPRCGAPVDYEIGVAHTPQVSLPTNPTEFDVHLRVMHETLVYNMGGYAAEHDEQHAVAANGRRDPKDIWIPHTHPEAT